jgi:hypothetical protein
VGVIKYISKVKQEQIDAARAAVETVKSMHAKGYSVGEIAAATNCTRYGIRYIARQDGWLARDKSIVEKVAARDARRSAIYGDRQAMEEQKLEARKIYQSWIDQYQAGDSILVIADRARVSRQWVSAVFAKCGFKPDRKAKVNTCKACGAEILDGCRARKYCTVECMRSVPRRTPKGSGVHSAKLTEADVAEIRKLRAEGMLLRDVAARYGVAVSNVSHICTGRNWRSVQHAANKCGH